jgi:hypothetical protein
MTATQTAPQAPVQPAANQAASSAPSYSQSFGAVHLPGFASKNPNVPIMKFLANLVKGALLAVSLGMGPGQALFLSLAAGTAGAGRSIGPLATLGAAPPVLAASSAGDMASRGAVSGIRTSLPSVRAPL